jgi:mono/diheme cytochrome c family protein
MRQVRARGVVAGIWLWFSAVSFSAQSTPNALTLRQLPSPNLSSQRLAVGRGVSESGVGSLRAGGASPRQTSQSGAPTGAAHQQLLTDYCVTCHNERLKTGGLVLDPSTLSNAAAHAGQWELVIRKLRAGLMPPPGVRRPPQQALDGFTQSLEQELDRAATASPNPGRPLLHRLNRTEYANAIRDLLHLNVDPTTLLPPDDSAFGFDNVSDVLGISPSLQERYLARRRRSARSPSATS